MELVSLDDVDHGVVEDPRPLVDAASLGDGGLGVVDDPSVLVDEACRGVDLDQPHLELCFLRWNDVKTLSLTLKSDLDLVLEACSLNLEVERNAHWFLVARHDGAPHSGVSCRRCTS